MKTLCVSVFVMVLTGASATAQNRLGLRTVAHADWTESLTATLEAGCGGIEHAARY